MYLFTYINYAHFYNFKSKEEFAVFLHDFKEIFVYCSELLQSLKVCFQIQAVFFAHYCVTVRLFYF